MDDILSIKGIHEFTFFDVQTKKVRSFTLRNLVTTAGKTMIAKRLAEEGNDCNITYAALGTNAAEPTVSDIALGTEYFRKQVTALTYSGVQVQVKSYFGITEANTTLREFGLFGEAASATPDSGTLFCKVAMNTVKTSAETLTIRSTITIS